MKDLKEGIGKTESQTKVNLREAAAKDKMARDIEVRNPRRNLRK